MSKTGEREKQIKIEQETKERKQMFSEHSRKKIEKAYRKVKEDLGDFMEPVDQYIRSLPEAEAAAMHYLYASMPYSDIGNYPVETFLDFARHGVWLYKQIHRFHKNRAGDKGEKADVFRTEPKENRESIP